MKQEVCKLIAQQWGNFSNSTMRVVGPGGSAWKCDGLQVCRRTRGEVHPAEHAMVSWNHGEFEVMVNQSFVKLKPCRGPWRLRISIWGIICSMWSWIRPSSKLIVLQAQPPAQPPASHTCFMCAHQGDAMVHHYHVDVYICFWSRRPLWMRRLHRWVSWHS